jgi:hypothetical protein
MARVQSKLPLLTFIAVAVIAAVFRLGGTVQNLYRTGLDAFQP